MPDKSTLEAIGESSEKLLHKAMENVELCQRFMAFVSLCALTCEQRGTPLDGVRVGAVTMSERKMVAKVTFSRLSLVHSAPPETKAANSFLEFTRKEAEGIYLMIRKNPDFVRYLESMVEHMESYSKWKLKKFSSLKFQDGYMDKNDNIVMKIEA